MALHTTGSVIDALGGNAAVAKLLGISPNVVSNWRMAERFPAHTYLTLRDHLKAARKNKNVPDDLWAMARRSKSA